MCVSVLEISSSWYSAMQLLQPRHFDSFWHYQSRHPRQPYQCGVDGGAFSWQHSYFTNRINHVTLGDQSSGAYRGVYRDLYPQVRWRGGATGKAFGLAISRSQVQILLEALPSVLWHCWLGHLTRKTVSEMTYNVFSGTLNPTHSPCSRQCCVPTLDKLFTLMCLCHQAV